MAEIQRARRHGLPGLRPRGAGLRGLSLRASCGTFICLICTFRGVTLCRECAAKEAAAVMTAVIARAAIVPLFAQPTLRSEQASQLVLGETAAVLESAGDWRRVRTDSTATRAGSTPGTASRSTTDGPRPGGRRPPAGAWAPPCASAKGQRSDSRSAPGWRSTSETVRLPDGRRGQVVEGASRLRGRSGAGGARQGRPSTGRSSTSRARRISGAG